MIADKQEALARYSYVLEATKDADRKYSPVHYYARLGVVREIQRAYKLIRSLISGDKLCDTSYAEGVMVDLHNLLIEYGEDIPL